MAAPFALAPALVNAGVIDYSTSEGKKLYNGATKSLADDNESLYDGTSEQLSSFLHRLKVRATEYGWIDGGVLDIDISPPGAAVPVLVNLIDKYGDLTLAQVEQHVRAYNGVQNRAAQDCMQVYHCVMKSLTNDAVNKIRNKAQDYTINGTPSGVLLVKVLVREAHLDTNATVTRIRTEIANLDQYMIKIKGNVMKFNLHVEELVNQLRARGEESNELLTNLFQAYKMCNDDPFIRYIESKENDYDDGEAITPQALMATAGNKYQVRVDKGQWQSPSQSQTQIIALKAEVKRLKTKSTKNKKKDRDRQTTKGNQTSTKSTQRKPDWMLKHPTAAEKRSGSKKKVDGKMYYWCTTHKAWGRHKPSECRGVNYRPNHDNTATNSRSSSQNSNAPTTENLVQQQVTQEDNANIQQDEDSAYESE